ncbi:MAG TPA: D-2-hydroxyacid dehydrogenase [Patescibacteria group bacterium]|nr:D-2-hydroxyacid dehydrogenase [Patescibacteria group bacterium]
MLLLLIGEPNVAPYDESHFAQIKKVAPKVEIVSTNDTEEIKKNLPNAEIVITSPQHFGLIDLTLTKNLKWIHMSSAGVTDAARILAPTDIILTNSSGVHPIPISETVLGYILMFARRLDVAYRNQVLNKSWSRNVGNNRGMELVDKTIGIVGFGRIGQEIARLCRGIGMKAVALQYSQPLDKSMIDHTFENIDELLEKADFVVDCLPLTPETKGYFDADRFKSMRDSAYFINIGRGGTVAEHDLITALKEGTIAGAGLDVFEVEPLPDSSPLWSLENVIITPHISGWTPEYTNRVVNIFCANLEAYLSGKPMQTLVNKDKGY